MGVMSTLLGSISGLTGSCESKLSSSGTSVWNIDCFPLGDFVCVNSLLKYSEAAAASCRGLPCFGLFVLDRAVDPAEIRMDCRTSFPTRSSDAEPLRGDVTAGGLKLVFII